jgi:hypothetical protein
VCHHFDVLPKISLAWAASGRYPSAMNQAVASLEHAVEQLGWDDLALFREWFSSFEAAEWDARIERFSTCPRRFSNVRHGLIGRNSD